MSRADAKEEKKCIYYSITTERNARELITLNQEPHTPCRKEKDTTRKDGKYNIMHDTVYECNEPCTDSS